MSENWENKLFFGDNLDILREHIPDESVDLIYLDPPFNSKATYNVLFREQSGEESTAQITAFEDTWHWGLESEKTYHELVTQGTKKLADLIQALRSFLGQNDMMAYLTMMGIRLVEMHRVLNRSGSIYLHCDPTASHYLKLLMDTVFGVQNFRNEIIWCYRTGGISKKWFGRKHDIILSYSKNLGESYFSSLKEKTYIPTLKGRKFAIEELKARIDNEGCQICGQKGGFFHMGAMRDVWEIPPLRRNSRERLSYPTQKPEALLERIIKASSKEDDIVLDPFCGCGTTIVVAERLNRRWIGVDITHLAISLMKYRLQDTLGTELSPYKVIGDPKDFEGAEALAEENRYQFEWWALGLVDARPAQDKKKGPDTGIDGYINFFDDKSGKAKKIIVQVKSGKVNRSQIGDLKGIMEREKAVIGAFITLKEPTRPMLKEAASAGFYEPKYFPGQRYPRLQMLTIKDLLGGKKLEYLQMGESTFKKAQRKSKKGIEDQGDLF